jgi:hypothetical protein
MAQSRQWEEEGKEENVQKLRTEKRTFEAFSGSILVTVTLTMIYDISDTCARGKMFFLHFPIVNLS